MNATWATKYRPNTPDELVGSARDMYHAFDNIQHAIIHSREAGTGKTTFAHVLAKERGWPIHVFNASSKKTRGIAFVEEELLPLIAPELPVIIQVLPMPLLLYHH